MITAELLVAAGPQVGLGHFRRMQVLANELASRGAAVRWRVTDAGLAQRLGGSLFDPQARLSSDLVIVDGYDFDLRDIAARAERLLCVIDDLGDRHVEADVVVNPNLYGRDLFYPGAEMVLAGVDYAMVSGEFARAAARLPRPHGPTLVSLGGAERFVSKAFALAALLRSTSDHGVEVALPVAPSIAPLASLTLHIGRDLAVLMPGAGRVVVGLGVSFLEALACRRPVFGLLLAQNQRLAFAAAERVGLPVTAEEEPAAIVADILRKGFSHPGVGVEIDAAGAGRVAEALLRLAKAKS